MKSLKNKKTLLDVAHEMAKGLHKSGVIDKITMHEFDALCLSPIKDFSSQEIKKLREREEVSQTVFAMYLNITPSTVQQWERGDKHPRGTSLKLLNIVANRGITAIA